MAGRRRIVDIVYTLNEADSDDEGELDFSSGSDEEYQPNKSSECESSDGADMDSELSEGREIPQDLTVVEGLEAGETLELPQAEVQKIPPDISDVEELEAGETLELLQADVLEIPLDISDVEELEVGETLELDVDVAVPVEPEIVADVQEPLENNQNRGRKRARVGSKRDVSKKLRNSGKAYVGHRGVEVAARSLKPVGNHKCRYNCSDFSDQERSQIFSEYWALGTWDLQTAFICSCVSKKLPKRPRPNARRARKCSKVITLKHKRVCKDLFLKTLDISNVRFSYVSEKLGETLVAPPDERGKHEPRNKTAEVDIEFIKNHIRSFPKYKNHYCRAQNPNRHYLASNLTLKKMYDLYTEKCKEENRTPKKEWLYRKIFNLEFNLSFHPPHTDTCSKCDTFETLIKASNGAEAEELTRERDIHHEVAEFAVRSKRNDKLDVKARANNETVAFTFDLQKTLPTPSLTTNKVFYLRVLWTYNLGIHDLATGKAKMFMWDESTASRGSQEVGSCILKYAESLTLETKHIIAYSDCCGGQNRNNNIVKYWMYIIQKTSVETVDHKFLEPGHTYMECDEDFGLIEKYKRQVKYVFEPADWMDAVSKTSTNFEVVEMGSDDFYSISKMSEVTRVPKNDSEKQSISWRKIKWIAVSQANPLEMKFKYSLRPEEPFRIASFAPVRAPGRPAIVQLDKIDGNNPIKFAKWKNLQELKSFIPAIHHNFYDNLLHDGEQRANNPGRGGGRGRGRGRGRGSGVLIPRNMPQVVEPVTDSDVDSDFNDDDNPIVDSDYSD